MSYSTLGTIPENEPAFYFTNQQPFTQRSVRTRSATPQRELATPLNIHPELLSTIKFENMNVVLDLDNTLLETLSYDKFNMLPPAFTQNFETYPLPEYNMVVVARPGLKAFMDYLFDNFIVSVFTAATRDYSKLIRDRVLAPKLANGMPSLTPNGSPRVFYKALDSRHNKHSIQKYGSMKDLRTFEDFGVFGIEPCNTVMIDDLDEVQAANPNNVIRIIPFNLFTSHYRSCNPTATYDSELARVSKEIENRFGKWTTTRCVYDEYNPIQKTCGVSARYQPEPFRYGCGCNRK